MLKFFKRKLSNCYPADGEIPELQEVPLEDLPVKNDRNSVFYEDYLNSPSPSENSLSYPTLTFKNNTYKANVVNSPGAKIVFTEITLSSGERVLQPASKNPEEIYVSLGAIKLIDSLRLLYKTEEGFFIPFPWLRNSQYEAEDHYVPLMLNEWGRGGQRLIESDIELENIFHGRNGSTAPRRILVQAEPGNGKTTLCIRLVYTWAKNEESTLSRFKLAILVRLRIIEEQSLEDYVTSFCHKAMPNTSSADTIKNILKDLGDELLLILDGFDEATKKVQRSVNDVLGFKKRSSCQSFLRNATVLTTSRPLKELENSRCFERRINIEGIKSDYRDDFINRYVRDETAATRLKTLLKTTTFAHKISPLTLTILCYLQVKEAVSKFETEWELIGTILNTLGERCLQKEKIVSKGFSYWVIFCKLGGMYYNKGNTTASLTEKELQSNFTPEDLKFLKGCGILVKPPSFDFRNDEDSFEPLHKTFAEFLIAIYLKWEWDTKYPAESKTSFLVQLLRPCIEKEGIKAFDVTCSEEIKFTCPVINGVLVVVTFRNNHTNGSSVPIECEFLTSSFATMFYKDLNEVETLIKVKSIVKFLHFCPQSAAIPPQFRQGINQLCPMEIKYEKGIQFTYIIYRKSKVEFEPDTLAIKDQTVKEIIFFEYAEQSSQRNPTVSTCHGQEGMELMLKRAINYSSAVISTTLFFNVRQMIRLFPATQMHTLETVGEYAILQEALRKFTKHYLKCKDPFYIVPEEKMEIKDFVRRFFKSVFSSTVAMEIVATWHYHGHVFQCVHDPQKNETQAYHAQPEVVRKQSVPMKVNQMVNKIASVAEEHNFLSEIFHIQYSMSANRVSLVINLREQLVRKRRTVTWKILKIKHS